MGKAIVFFLSNLFLTLNYCFAQCPTVDAGPDQIHCSSNVFELQGSFSNDGYGCWRSSNGGNFAPVSCVSNAFYILPDQLQGYSMLILSSTKPDCPVVEDTMYVFLNVPIVVECGFPYAGPCCTETLYLTEKTVCPDDSVVELYGLIYMGDPFFFTSYGPYPITWPNTGIWTTSGSGSFANPNSPRTKYMLSQEDFNSGRIKLTLTSTQMGDCQNKSQDIFINVENCTVTNNASQINSDLFYYYTGKNTFIRVPDEFENGEIYIYNSSGVLVRSLKISNTNIEIADLPNGIYFLKSFNESRVLNKKILIE